MAGDYLGGEGYWAGGLHLYTPLPFRPGRGGFGDLFRTHFFLNAGNLCNLNYGERKRLFYGPEPGGSVLFGSFWAEAELQLLIQHCAGPEVVFFTQGRGHKHI